MAIAKPFIAVRPAKEKVALVASRPITTYTADQLRNKLASNPDSFLNIINPDHALPEAEQSQGKKRFVKVRSAYERFLKEGILQRDTEPAFFLYRQSGPTGSFMGLIAGVSCHDYNSDVIKKHEQTLSKRQGLFTDYLDYTDFNAEPVLISYPDDEGLGDISAQIALAKPDQDFTTSDSVHHTLWVINEPSVVKSIETLFAVMPALYIADGHHRSASSALLMEKRKAENPRHNGTEPYNFFMAMLLPESQLRIFPFHRLVHDLNGMSDAQFLGAAEKLFQVQIMAHAEEPKRGQVLFFTPDTVAMLTAKEYSTAAGNIDAQMLTDRILSPLLDIHDLRTDKRVEFSGGPDAFEQMKAAVQSGRFRAGFALAPCRTEDITYTADRGLTMPPKSTWIEPKMRSGLTIYELG